MAKFKVSLVQTVSYVHTVVVECEDEGQIYQACYDNSDSLDEAIAQFEEEGIKILEQDEGTSPSSEFDIDNICEVEK